ncbi:MAG: ATP-dependent Clp protease proteolytic subunit [Deltaproteobacteria bacterium]|jgi:ATP-dependent Clp protease protease subunit|nr:ATP-dependent Clp protease proteolytic subunit [Deltaproteobacteria bacterium]
MNAKQDESSPLTNPFFRMADRLFEARTLLIHGEVTSLLAQQVTAQLLALEADGDDPITVFIHSEGGHVEAGDSIHDMIRFVKPQVRMVGTGWVASAGTHIYLAAPKEDRLCLPNTRFMIHQPLGGVGGRASDIRIEAEEIVKARERLNRTISEATGQPLEKVEQDTDRNYWMSPEEALEYGIVGRIVASSSEL